MSYSLGSYNFRGIACLPDACEYVRAGLLLPTLSVATTTMLQFLIRVFAVAAYAIFFALGSLLDGEGAWAAKVRRLVKQRHSWEPNPAA